jgi:SAM-dependent methyltransferase
VGTRLNQPTSEAVPVESIMAYWDPFLADFPSHDDFRRGARVLDVGFGEGAQLVAVKARGGEVCGVEYAPALVDAARARGFDVQHAPAERLPYPDATFDGLICKVVVPYTDEARAVSEWGRVLKPGALALVSYHGAGYYLHYLLEGGEGWKYRVYGLRSLVNTWVYRWSGRRLPGFVGDTLYQAEARLRRYYEKAGLQIESRTLGRTYLGFPVFIHHRLRR